MLRCFCAEVECLDENVELRTKKVERFTGKVESFTRKVEHVVSIRRFLRENIVYQNSAPKKLNSTPKNEKNILCK